MLYKNVIDLCISCVLATFNKDDAAAAADDDDENVVSSQRECASDTQNWAADCKKI